MAKQIDKVQPQRPDEYTFDLDSDCNMAFLTNFGRHAWTTLTQKILFVWQKASSGSFIWKKVAFKTR